MYKQNPKKYHLIQLFKKYNKNLYCMFCHGYRKPDKNDPICIESENCGTIWNSNYGKKSW